MSLIDRLPTLPQGFTYVHGERGVIACRSGLEPLLSASGFFADALHASEYLPGAAESGREPLALLDLDGTDALVRRFTHGGLARKLTGRIFRDPTRPFSELRSSEALRSLNIPTPKVLAARAVARRGGFELALIIEREREARDVGRILGDVRAGRSPERVLRRALIDAGKLVAALHEIGFVHADLQPANILVRPRGQRGAMVLDLDGSYFVSTEGRGDTPRGDPEGLPRGVRVRNLSRLWRHVQRREVEFGRVLGELDLGLFLTAYGVQEPQVSTFAREVERARERSSALHRLGWWLSLIHI